jgi:hypothetical protein
MGRKVLIMIDPFEGIDMPMPIPQYENCCWNCKAEINDIICEWGGLDPLTGEPNGYICNICGKHLGDLRHASGSNSTNIVLIN